MRNFFKKPFKKNKRELLDEANQDIYELQEELIKEQQQSERLQVQFSIREFEKEELLKQKDNELTQAKELIGSLKLRAQTDVDKRQALENELSCQKCLVEENSKRISWLSEALRDVIKQLPQQNKEDPTEPNLLEQTPKVKLEEEKEKKRHRDRDSQRQEQDKIITELQEKLKEERDTTAGLYKQLGQKELRLNINAELLEKMSSENEELKKALQTEREKREEERKEKEERESETGDTTKVDGGVDEEECERLKHLQMGKMDDDDEYY